MAIKACNSLHKMQEDREVSNLRIRNKENTFYYVFRGTSEWAIKPLISSNFLALY